MSNNTSPAGSSGVLTSEERMSIGGLADFVVASKRVTTNKVRRAVVAASLFVALLAHLDSFVAGRYADVELATRLAVFVLAVAVAARVVQELYLISARKALKVRLTVVLSDLIDQVDVDQMLAERVAAE